jgi:hypothetical protein
MTSSPQTPVRDMFATVSILAPAATRIARSGSPGCGPARKVGEIGDIVNFVNFTSGPILPNRGGSAD